MVFHHLTCCDCDRKSLGALISSIADAVSDAAHIEIEMIGPSSNPHVKVYSDHPTVVQDAISKHYNDPNMTDDDMFGSWQIFKAGQRIEFRTNIEVLPLERHPLAGALVLAGEEWTTGDVMWGTDDAVFVYCRAYGAYTTLYVKNGTWRDQDGRPIMIAWLKG